MSIRWGTVLLAVASALAACSNRSSSTSTSTPAATDGASDGSAAGAGSDVSEGTPMKEIQKQLAKQFKVSPEDVQVSVIEKPAVPGVTPFTAAIDPKKLGRNASASGALVGDKILTEKAALSAVAKAWGYGANRPVSAVDVAKVFSKLHSERGNTSSIFDADTLDVFKSTAHKEIAAAAALPSEETVDGLPAVKYNVTGGSLPFLVVTAIFKPDFSVELRTQEVLKGGGGRD